MEEKETKGREIDFQEIFTLLRKYIWWLIIGAVIGGLCGWGYTKLFVQQTYYSQATFYCISAPGSTSSGELGSREALARHYLGLMKSERMLASAVDAFGGELTMGQLSGMIQASTSDETAQITINFVSSDKALPSKVCDYFIHNAPEIVSSTIEGGELKYLGALDADGNPVARPVYQSSMPYRRNTVIGAVAVLAVIAIILILRSLFNDTVADAVHLQQHVNITILGEVPEFENSSSKKYKYGYKYGYGGKKK